MASKQTMRSWVAGGLALAAGVATAGSCIVSGSTERPFGIQTDEAAVEADVRTCVAAATADDALSPFDARTFTMDWFEIEEFSSFPRLGFLLLLQ